MLFRKLKTKTTGIVGSVSSGLGIAGLHNVCHTICQGIVVFLAVFGITVVGMPLAFLQDYSLLFSTMGLISGAAGVFIFYWFKVRCSMKKTKKDWFWFAFNFFVLIISATAIISGLK